MRIYAWGDDWSGISFPYLLPQLEAADTWVSQQPAVISQIGGASGAYDFFGDFPSPVKNMPVTKRMRIKGSSYDDVDTQVLALASALRSAGKIRLWFHIRGTVDASHMRWMWVKVVSIDGIAEKIQERPYLHKDITVTWEAPEGLWYGDTQHEETKTSTGQFQLSYSGNWFAPVTVRMYALTTSPVEAFNLEMWMKDSGAVAAPLQVAEIDWSDLVAGVPVGSYVAVKSDDYSCYMYPALTDEYEHLTVGTAGIEHITFMFVPFTPPPYDQVWADLKSVTQTGGGTWQLYLSWWDTYVY